MRRMFLAALCSFTLIGCGGSDDAPAPSVPADSGATARDAAPTDTAPVDTGTIAMDTAPADTSCTPNRDGALGPVAKVSTGEVKVLETVGAVKTIYVDASAGGSAMAASNPWVYLDLTTAARVDIDDRAALTATTWDLAVKRPLFRSNSGDGGAGAGGAVFLAGKAFDAVTDTEARAAAPATEDWFDASCALIKDAAGSIKTSFDGWYEYDSTTMKLSPAPGTWIVRGAKGALYRVEIKSYYANPDGTIGATSARYVLRVAEVK